MHSRMGAYLKLTFSNRPNANQRRPVPSLALPIPAAPPARRPLPSPPLHGARRSEHEARRRSFFTAAALLLQHGARSTTRPGWGAPGGALSPPRHSEHGVPRGASLSLSLACGPSSTTRRRWQPSRRRSSTTGSVTVVAGSAAGGQICARGGWIRRWWPNLGGGEHIRPKTSISDRLAWKRRPRPVASRASP